MQHSVKNMLAKIIIFFLICITITGRLLLLLIEEKITRNEMKIKVENSFFYVY